MSQIELWHKIKRKLDASLKLNEIEQAFYCLEEYLEEAHPDNDEKKDDLVLFMSQFDATVKRWLHTQITYSEYEIALSKIKQGLLHLHKSLKPPNVDVAPSTNLSEALTLFKEPEQAMKTDNSVVDKYVSLIDYEWNFEENIMLYIQFEKTSNDTNDVFNALIKDAEWEQFIRRDRYLFTEEEPWGVRIPETVNPDENEPGFIKIEERPILWLDAIRFEVKDDELTVIAESLVIKKEKEGQIWLHAIGEPNAKSQFVSSLLRWFDEKLQDVTSFTLCFNVPKGKGATIHPITENELEISVKQPFEID